MSSASKRFNITAIPLVNLYVATDAQRRLRLSADIIDLYGLDSGDGPAKRVMLGYDANERAIALRLAENSADPTAANIDKRGYISATRFYRTTQIPAISRRYVFEAEEDGWLVFISEGASSES